MNKTVRAKRNASTQGAIKKKVAEGKATGKERAVVRVGRGGTKVMTGQEDLSEWDDEELRQGRRRGKDGTFVGRKPVIVPKAIHDELVKRTLSKAEALMRDNLIVAVEALTEIVKGEDVEEKDRLRAIDMIMTRVMGKPVDKHEFTGETPPWQVAVNAGIVSINAKSIGGDEDSDDEEG